MEMRSVLAVGRRRFSIAAVVLFELVVITFLCWGLVLLGGIRDYPIEHDPKPADAVVVFAGEDARFLLGRTLVDRGVAPVLVLSAGSLPAAFAGWCDGGTSEVEVLCLTPEPSSTVGEAEAFSALARRRGWGDLVAVTGDYHARRVLALMSACWDGTVKVAAVDWPTPEPSLLRKEWFGSLAASLRVTRCT